MNCLRPAKPASPAACAGALLLLGVLLGAGGCKGRENAVEDTGTDNAFLRYPSDMTAKPDAADENAPALGVGPLFPLGVGSHWEMQTVQGTIVPGADGARLVQNLRQGSEKIIAVKKTTVGSQSGVIFDITTTGGDAKAPGKTTTRQETYGANQSGLFLLGAGSDAGYMTMAPALPLVSYPPKEGQPLQWSGVLHYKNQTVPATSVSRAARIETIKVPGFPKGVRVWRIDTVVSTTLLQNGLAQQVSFPTTRWLAPGVGMVRQKLISGDQLVTKEIKTWTLK